MVKKIALGILAHVDAGKTTLSESLLYIGGSIKHIGRVDKQSAFLDTHAVEKERGITVFSKQAVIHHHNHMIFLIDTPGHVDFSAEMERTLRVLDYAILLISGTDGVQAHTKTLWRLLDLYGIPTFIFVNKMDVGHVDQKALLADLKRHLSDRCMPLNNPIFNDDIALCSEALMNTYLEKGVFDELVLSQAIARREIFPCYFGSALKGTGVEALFRDVTSLTKEPPYQEHFSARVFKVSRDEQGNRLTHLKLLGGSLRVKDSISYGDWEEKVNQIRMYSGNKYNSVPEAFAGDVCSVVGLRFSKIGDVYGEKANHDTPMMQMVPVLTYQLVFDHDLDSKMVYPRLIIIEEEFPEYAFMWDERGQHIRVNIMGDVHIEVLQRLIEDRLGMKVAFDDGSILYKETIEATVEGVGHFEPLKHYAEVHLLLEPLERGAGVVFANRCRDDILGKNWQNLVMTHLNERVHKGVLTGSDLTDVRISLLSGRAHPKHTSGGDFREATFRALRQGLMEAKSVLLEPYYQFTIELPQEMVGRAMFDIEQMRGKSSVVRSDGEMTLLEGRAPVSKMRHYYKDIIAYTKGLGVLTTEFAGYDVCQDHQLVIDNMAYEPNHDVDHPSSSIFCEGGVGTIIPWDEVKKHRHVESQWKNDDKEAEEAKHVGLSASNVQTLSLEEIDAIIQNASSANRGRKNTWQKPKKHTYTTYEVTPVVRKAKIEAYLLIDGYNIIHALEGLKDMMTVSLEASREALLEKLCNLQGVIDEKIMVVFDAYRIQNGKEHQEAYKNIQVIYTKEAQTADQYIESFAHQHKQHYDITVATSDALEQLIIRGAGCKVISADSFSKWLDQTDILIDSLKEKHEPTTLKDVGIRTASINLDENA